MLFLRITWLLGLFPTLCGKFSVPGQGSELGSVCRGPSPDKDGRADGRMGDSFGIGYCGLLTCCVETVLREHVVIAVWLLS
jgi:hypothetical protein